MKTSDEFNTIVKYCLTNRTASQDIPAEHLRERLAYLGDGRERVYCFLTLIEDARGFRWFAYILATRNGELEDELLPLAEWSAARQLNACQFRALFAELEPRMIEDRDTEGYIFRGPYAAQMSEPQSAGVLPSHSHHG